MKSARLSFSSLTRRGGTPLALARARGRGGKFPLLGLRRGGAQRRAGYSALWLAFALAVNVALAFTPNTYELPVWFKQSFLLVAEDVEEATANDKRVVLFFGQDGCPYCKKLIEVNLKDEKIGNFAREHFDFIALNIFGAREVLWVDGKPRPENELAAHLNVRATPTLIFLDEKGNIVGRLTGYDPPEEFMRLLKRVAAEVVAGARFSN